MITTHTDLTENPPALSLMNLKPEECVFFDIETTGFQPDHTRVYLIGAAHRTAAGWRVTQWMIEDLSEEDALLRVFSAFLRPYRALIHFNGNQFDLPYLRRKYDASGLPFPLYSLHSTDIFRDLFPLRSLFGLKRMNQKTLEAFLGLDREDRFGGGELIPVFRRFLSSADPTDRQLLLLHNLEDVKGMLQLTKLYAFRQLLSPVTPSASVSGKSLILSASYPQPFPVPLQPGPGHKSEEKAFLCVGGSRAVMEIPLYQGCLAHFFKDYRNYYYLPREDEALHKSVASFVDRQFRTQATARTCYTKRTGSFLPAFGYEALPLFQSDYEDKERWILLPEDLKDAAGRTLPQCRDEAFLPGYWLHAMHALMRA